MPEKDRIHHITILGKSLRANEWLFQHYNSIKEDEEKVKELYLIITGVQSVDGKEAISEILRKQILM